MKQLGLAASAIGLVFCGAQAFSQPGKPQPKGPGTAASAKAAASATPSHGSSPAGSSRAASAKPAASAAPIASAAPATSAPLPIPPIVAPGATPGGTPPPIPGIAPLPPRRKVPKAPDPTPAQLAALAELSKEAEAYEADARDYRNTMTRIIQHHYQEKKKRVLKALDREIAAENKALRDARDEAIKKHEAFIAKYSGANADQEATPDTMFKLAALYEERARDIAQETPVPAGQPPPEPDLAPAIAKYKDIVRLFPHYKELAGVLYYLGHAYNDVGRIDEAQQVWRSLVCHNRYAYPVPPDPKDPTRDSIARLPQDHEADWWLGWLSRHSEPLDKAREKRGQAIKQAEKQARARGQAIKEPPAGASDEEEFNDPFPADCTPIAQETEPGEPPRYIGEVWWRIGDYHFDEIDPWGGPYNLNRAESAYNQALKFDKPPVYDVSMYKLAWTFFKQQRYETAVQQFIKLLNLTDKREAETGNPGADFRNEAYAYIAASMTYLDFKGPPKGDPYLARNDVFDVYQDPAQIEEAMHPGIDRVKDPNLIPQDKKWTIEIYKALAFEYKEYNQLHNLIEIDQLILDRWPNHRDAPMVQNQIAVTYEQLASGARGAEAEKYAAAALEARGKLVNYVEQPGGVIPDWVKANQEDPEAIHAAEALVHGGLRRAAADHTNAARKWVREARGTSDAAERESAFRRALREYQAASVAWGSYLNQDENADDAYDSRFWLADSYTSYVLVKAELADLPDIGIPTPEEVVIAQQTAREVRDSNDSDDKMQPAAMMVVQAAQAVVRASYRANAKDPAKGFPEVKEVQTEKYEEDGDKRERAVKQEVPKALLDVIAAFDEYRDRVPLEKEPDPADPNHNAFAYNAGETEFFYGQFDDAKKRLTPIYQQQCGTTKYGFAAWKKLTTMAARERDNDTSRKLAEADKQKTCALTDTDKLYASNLGKDILDSAFYKEAYGAFDAANKMPDDPQHAVEKRALYQKAAELYEGALKNAPDRDEAPEAAINGAIAYKQIGNYDKAIAMYELFIGAYGKDELLDGLRDGDKTKKTAAQPEKYAQRVRFLKQAYDALGEAYVLFFDYRRAAQTYDKISSIDRSVPPLKDKDGKEKPGSKGFDEGSRRDAAQNAVFLYLNIGDHDRVEATKKRFFAMNPPKEQQAEIEWLIAQGDLKGWDDKAPDRGDNSRARLRAAAAMESYYVKWNKDPAAAAFTVQAAYMEAKLRRAGNDSKAKDWCDNTRSAFDTYKSNAGKDEKGQNKALGSLQADYAAECKYRDIDEDIKKNFDYDTGHHRYAGEIIDVKKAFTDDVEKGAKNYYDQLQRVIDDYHSGRWSTAARARQGSLFDSCRTGLYNAREPGLKLWSDKIKIRTKDGKEKTEAEVIKELDKLCTETGNDTACTQFDARTAKRRTDWRQERDKLLEAADKAMVVNYTESILWAQLFRSRVKEVDNAVARLAYHQDIIGDAKLRDYTSTLKDPNHKDESGQAQPFEYKDGMFLGMRRGLIVEPKTDVVVSPLPANPQGG